MCLIGYHIKIGKVEEEKAFKPTLWNENLREVGNHKRAKQ